MNRNTALTVSVIIAIAIVAIIAWSITMRPSDTTQEEYLGTSPVPPVPQEDISVDGSIDSDINALDQQLQEL